MREFYTRPCNFYYGNFANKLISQKKALPLTGNLKIAFDQIEIFNRSKENIAKKEIYHINKIDNLNKKKIRQIKIDLKNITSKREAF